MGWLVYHIFRHSSKCLYRHQIIIRDGMAADGVVLTADVFSQGTIVAHARPLPNLTVAFWPTSSVHSPMVFGMLSGVST